MRPRWSTAVFFHASATIDRLPRLRVQLDDFDEALSIDQ